MKEYPCFFKCYNEIIVTELDFHFIGKQDFWAIFIMLITLGQNLVAVHCRFFINNKTQYIFNKHLIQCCDCANCI